MRLLGELSGWSRALFNPEPGGGGAIVGIAWLVPLFGIYFALKLHRAGLVPGGFRALVAGALGLASFFLVFAVLGRLLRLDPTQPSTAALLAAILASLTALAVVTLGAPVLSKVLLLYGLAARVPVLLVMLVAMLGSWNTHYDAAPPGLPETGVFMKWLTIGVAPQLTVWMAFTVVVGAFFGGIALLLAPLRRPQQQTA